jgi:hypothetical protein
MNSHATRNPAPGPSDRAAYVYIPPADGYSFASWPIAVAAQMHAISASPTDSGSACYASGTEMKIEYATAAAGAMCVIDWNSTCGSPIDARADGRSRGWRSSLRLPSRSLPGSTQTPANANIAERGRTLDEPDRIATP